MPPAQCFFVVSNDAFGNAFLSLAVKMLPLITNEGFVHEDSMGLSRTSLLLSNLFMIELLTTTYLVFPPGQTSAELFNRAHSIRLLCKYSSSVLFRHLMIRIDGNCAVFVSQDELCRVKSLSGLDLNTEILKFYW